MNSLFWNAVVVLLLVSIPFGIGMAFYTSDAEWLFFSAPILLFLS